MKVWIVIPAYNEEKKIVEVIKGLKENGYNNIVIIDDGSKDKTYQNAVSQDVSVLHHVINRGQGAALKTGIDYALSKGADIIVTFDADGQHRAEDISKLIKPIEDGKVSVALGNRFLGKDSNTPFIRKTFLKGGAFLFRCFYGVKVNDSHNGFRALSRFAAERINLCSDGMEHASEIIEEVGKRKLKYCEVPVNIRYTDYSLKHGQNNLAAFKILFKMLIKSFLR